MKTHHIILLAALALTACHDDKTLQAPEIADKTYDASSGLELYYNGAVMPGKSVRFSQSCDKAEITAFAEFDLSQLSSMGLSGKIPAPGIIPGSPETQITTSVTRHDGGWIFSGKSSNDFCNYSYSGYADADKLTLNIENAKLNMAVNPAVWVPSPIVKDDKGGYKSLPFFIDWQFKPLPDVDIDLNAILTALTTMPVIPVYNNTAYMSVSQALTEVLRTVAFREDGNIIFTYINDSFGAARIDQTQPNGYQYVIDSPSSVRLFVNPLSLAGMILNNNSGGTPSSDVDLNDHGLFPAKAAPADGEKQILTPQMKADIMKSVMQYLLPQLAEGFPLSFEMTESHLNLFIDTETATQLATKILLPIIQDSPTVEAIVKYMEGNEELAPLLPYLKKGLQLIPSALERTTVFRFGFSFNPYAQK